MKPKSIKQFKFRPGIEIGSLSAEDDKFLFDAFVNKIEYQRLEDVGDPKSIILGRTGSGKSAILRQIENSVDHVTRINPEELSLQFISNSTILTYFRSLNIKLDLFYKLLWKHVIVIEILKLYFDNDGSSVSQKISEFISRIGKSSKYNKSLKYLNDFKGDFWKKSEERVKEVERTIEKEFSRSFNIPLSDLKIHLSSKKNISDSEKREIISKTESIIKDSQLNELLEVIQALREVLLPSTQKRFYIIVDDLDKDWIDEKIVNQLIKALVVTVYEFRNLGNVKILVALRRNIFELSFHDETSRDIQREKYQSVISDLSWTKEELTELVNNRLKILYKEYYTNQSPTVNDVFPRSKQNNSSVFDLILERTFMRPRDVIDFVNKSIQYSMGSSKITRDNFNKAEYDYSVGRLSAVIDEWKENYPSLHVIVSIFKGKPEPITFSDFTEKNFEELFIAAASGKLRDDLLKVYNSYFDGKVELLLLYQHLACILYKIGVLGVKPDPHQSTFYSFTSNREIHYSEIQAATKLYIHPAFTASLSRQRSFI